MARIRTMKPEFWDSPSTAQADLAVRLTFIAMWNWADDSGHGTANLKELEAFVFPNDEVTELPRMSSRNSGTTCRTWPSFAEVCHEVAEAYGVVFYKVRGRPYYWIPSFKDHQAKHFRNESRYPHVDEGVIVDVTSGNAKLSTTDNNPSDDSPNASSRNSGTTCRTSGIGTGEQGNRGTGEQGSSDPTDRGVPPADVIDREPTAQNIIGEWIDGQQQRPPKQVIGQLSKSVKSLLDEGTSYEEVRAAVAEWQHRNLNPSTLPSVLHEMRNPTNRKSNADLRLARGYEMSQNARPIDFENPFDQKAIGQ